MEHYYDIVLRFLLSVLILYYSVNIIFRYHASIDRIDFLLFILMGLLFLNYIGTYKIIEPLYLLLIILLTFLGAKLYFRKRQIYGYLLFNISKKDYKDIKSSLDAQMKDNLLSENQFCYQDKKPFLLVIKNIPWNTTKKLMKEFDLFLQKRPKTITFISYIQIIISLLLLAILWRF
ncbi:MAG: hypothetical protein KJ971_00285 [Firmicutes bacterium]|nr:hypothetical protein [Bacillota bacterium]